MIFRLFTVLTLLCGASFGQAIQPGGSTGGNSGGGSAMLACSGTPGNTTGALRQQCLDSSNNVWVCKNASGCTVAADWAQVTGAFPTSACQWTKYAVTISGGNWQVNGANPPGGAVALVGTSGPQSVNLAALAAQSVVEKVAIKNVAAWTSATGATVSVGSDQGTATSFLPAFDPTQAASNTWFGLASGAYTPTLATQNMQFTVTLSAGNISSMTGTNAANIWACVSVLP